MTFLRQSPRQPGTRHQFNMVEIVLALVIIVIGIIGIMGLFPASQEANLESRGRNYAGDASNQFLRYFSSKVKTRWALLNTLPINKPGTDEAAVSWAKGDSNGIFGNIPGVEIFYNDLDSDGKFDFEINEATGDNARDESGLFKLRQATAANVSDFEAVLRVWKSPATYKAYDNATNQWQGLQSVPPTAGVVMNLEVSWPAALPYDKRKTAVFTLDVFRPSESELADVRGAFTISEAGRLKFTYYGSESPVNSGFYMVQPEDKVIFASSKQTNQGAVVETTYEGGTAFNFYTRAVGGGLGTYKHYSYAATPPACECTCRVIGGELNINPNNSPDMEFTLIKADGGTITRDDLHEQSATTNAIYYSGKATQMKVKPKGNGNQNTFTMGGTTYELENRYLYVFTGDLNVEIYNDKVDKKGRCMGHWWVKTGAGCAQVRKEGEEHDARCPRHPNNRTATGGDIPYYDNPPRNLSGAYDSLTGNPYAMVITLVPGRRWLIGFEDLPADANGDGVLDGIDWDYNDLVVEVELVTQSGVVAQVPGHTVSGTITLNPNDGDWRATLAKAGGSIIEGTAMTAYSGAALALWARPTGNGSQTITVDGKSLTFDNEDMLAVSGTNLQVVIVQVGGLWQATFTGTDVTVTVMN